MDSGPGCLRRLCPAVGCTLVIPEDFVEKYCPEKLLKYRDFQLESFVSHNKVGMHVHTAYAAHRMISRYYMVHIRCVRMRIPSCFARRMTVFLSSKIRHSHLYVRTYDTHFAGGQLLPRPWMQQYSGISKTR